MSSIQTVNRPRQTQRRDEYCTPRQRSSGESAKRPFGLFTPVPKVGVQPYYTDLASP